MAAYKKTEIHQNIKWVTKKLFQWHRPYLTIRLGNRCIFRIVNVIKQLVAGWIHHLTHHCDPYDDDCVPSKCRGWIESTRWNTWHLHPCHEKFGCRLHVRSYRRGPWTALNRSIGGINVGMFLTRQPHSNWRHLRHLQLKSLRALTIEITRWPNYASGWNSSLLTRYAKIVINGLGIIIDPCGIYLVNRWWHCLIGLWSYIISNASIQK